MMMGSMPYTMLGMRGGFLGGEKGPPLLGMSMHEDINVEGEAADERAKVWAALWAAGEQADREVEAGGGGGQGMKRIKRLRTEQVRALEASFAEEGKLEPERKVELAEQLGLQPRQVAVWFQNRRARSKSKQLELDYATLSSHYHSLLAETHRLKAQVAQLTLELDHAKKETSKEGMPSNCCLGEAHKGEDSLKGAPFEKDVFAHERMTTTLNHHMQESSSCCSDYSVIIDSENSPSINQKDVSAYQCNNTEFSRLSHGWSEENLLATHQGLATSAYAIMQSHDLVLGDSTFTNNSSHVAMDWLWELAT